eukprot:scaffold90170_cov61-Phaeocystis_antarctica.AAC.2
MPGSVTPSRRCSGSAASLLSSAARLSDLPLMPKQLSRQRDIDTIGAGIFDICTAGTDKHEHRVAAAGERRGACESQLVCRTRGWREAETTAAARGESVEGWMRGSWVDWARGALGPVAVTTAEARGESARGI